VRARVSKEAGFGLIELLIAMTILNIGILALVGAFNASAVALGRASRISNAATLADTQMEVFRGLKYASIAQDCSEWNSALADSTFKAARTYQTYMKPSGSPSTTPKPLVPTVTDNSCTTTAPSPAAVTSTTVCPGTGSPRVVPVNCDPSRVVTGADRRTYRIDTYMYYDTASSTGRQMKVVTVVVRDAGATSRSLARITSTFDLATGS